MNNPKKISRPGWMARYFRRRETSGSGQNGFTLIEVLVAVMILGISLAVIMQLFSGGLKSNKMSSDYLYGIFHAREKMEDLLLTRQWVMGEQSGDFGDGYRWVADIEEVAPDTESGALDKAQADMIKNLPVSTLLIRLDVIWMSGEREKRFELAATALTEKLKTAESPEKSP